jgi:plastocyanin
MKKISTWLGLAVATVATHSVFAADITGKITLKGTPPPAAQVKDIVCGKPEKLTITSRQYSVGEGDGLADVFVYLKSGTGIDGKTFTPPADKPVLDQLDCEYHPFSLGVMAGQTFEVKNSDPVLHNVNSTRAKINKGKNFAQATKGMVSDMVFDKKEVPILFKCDVHPWMTAYVAVFDNPFFAVSDKDGNYTIKDVPAGKYQMVVYHRKTHGNDEGDVKEVTVEAGGAKENFTFEVK